MFIFVNKGFLFRIIDKNQNMQRPNQNEYAPFYETYVSKIGDQNILTVLATQAQKVTDILERIPADLEDYKYAEGKWSVKQLVQHVIDTERVFAIRMLRIARNDQTQNPGFDENDYANAATANHRTLSQLIEEFNSVRSATLHLIYSLESFDSEKTGIASGQAVSVRALAYIIAGHLIHHVQVLQERYIK